MNPKVTRPPVSGRNDVAVPPLDRQAQAAARDRWDMLTKPLGSLGVMEELGTRIAGMTGRPLPVFKRKVIFTVAADHGVVAEGVSAYPQAVTLQMVMNFLKGKAAINRLARQVGAEVLVVDAGCANDLPPSSKGLHICKIRRGTGNMLKEPAMSRAEAQAMVEAGQQVFQETNRSEPIDAVGLGDMGIGNTTASSALTALFLNRSVREITGLGAGLAQERLAHKIQVIEKVLDRHRPDPQDPLAVLAAVGGLEIACLAGITLAAAQAQVPVVLDGFITSAAALVASRLDPGTGDYLIASHRSVEPVHEAILTALGLDPLFDLKMRLGEGTGAALGLFLSEASLRLLTEMATFSEAGVSEKEKA